MASPPDERLSTQGLYREHSHYLGHSGDTVAQSSLTETLRACYGKVNILSYWAVPEEGKTHIEQNGSLSGYDGPVSLPVLVVDIDAPSLDDAQSLTTDVIEMLRALGLPDDQIRPWFSGGKGFHLHLPAGLITTDLDARVPRLVETCLEDVFGGLVQPKHSDEAGVDISMTRHANPTGLIRARWSLHDEAERFKVPVLVDELFSHEVAAIVSWAEAPAVHRNDVEHPPLDSDVEPVLRREAGLSLDDIGTTEVGTSPVTTTDTGDSHAPDTDADDAQKPDYITCMWHLHRRGPVDGRRHHDLERLAAAYAHKGLARDQIERLLKDWLDAPDKGLPLDDEGRRDCEDLAARVTGQHPAEDDKRWRRFQCSDDIMDEFCDTSCLFYKYKGEEDPIMDGDDMMSQLTQYMDKSEASDLNLNMAYDGLDVPFHPGDVVLLLGDTKLGKSSFWQNFNLEVSPLRVLDLSMEMHPGLHARRYVQIAYGLRVNKQQGINDIKKARQAGKLEPMKQALDHIRIITTTPEVSDLERLVRETQADIVVVDPLEKLSVEGRGTNSSMEIAMRTIKDLARRTGVVFFITNHINKAGQRKNRINLADSKGLKAITEESNYVFAFEGEDGLPHRHLSLLRSTHNVEVDTTLTGDPDTLEFWVADDIGVQAGEEPLTTDDLPS